MINSTEKFIFFPFIKTIKHYNLTKLKADLLSGFTVAMVALPQSMAYAVIAGIHPKYGLYASIIPVIISSLFRSSRYLIAGATNATAMVTASTLSSIVIGNLVADSLPDPQKIQLLFLLVFLMGVIQLILGIARFGNLINFVSHSVTIGFTTGVGLLIALNQIKNLFGISIPTNSMAVKTIFQIVQHIEFTNYRYWNYCWYPYFKKNTTTRTRFIFDNIHHDICCNYFSTRSVRRQIGWKYSTNIPTSVFFPV